LQSLATWVMLRRHPCESDAASRNRAKLPEAQRVLEVEVASQLGAREGMHAPGERATGEQVHVAPLELACARSGERKLETPFLDEAVHLVEHHSAAVILRDQSIEALGRGQDVGVDVGLQNVQVQGIR
jgi:hypothetical protein